MTHIPGKSRVFLPNLSFVGPYRAKCDEIAAAGWKGFVIDGASATTREGASA